MASTINATTAGGGGVVTTADASGVLELQGGGNTGISISVTGVPTITAPTVSGVLTGVGSQSVISYLGASVSMASANTWYDGPNTGSIGASGQKWLIVACGSIWNAGGQVYGEIAIWNGSAYIGAQGSVGANTNWQALGTASAIVTLTGATTFTLRGAANAANSTLLKDAVYVSGYATYIYAVRLA